MANKLFNFTASFDVVADTEEEAIQKLQEILNEAEDGIMKAENWIVEEIKDAEISG